MTSSTVTTLVRAVISAASQEPLVVSPCSSGKRHSEVVHSGRTECMNCDEVLLCLWEYLDQELAREEAEAVADHLGYCARCRPAYRCNQALLDCVARQRTAG